MTTRTATNQTELDTALGLSVGGDIVECTGGTSDYNGNIENYSFASEVIIRKGATRPDFGFVRIDNCDNLAFEDIDFTLNDTFDDGGSICIVQNGCTNIRLERCYSAGRDKCFFINGGSGHTIKDCYVDRVGQGGFTFQAISNTTIQGCYTLGLFFMATSAHGDFMQFSGVCSNVTVKDNYLIDPWTFDDSISGPEISSVSGSGTITVNTSTVHGLTTGDRVALLDPTGVRADGWGWFDVTVVDTDTFTVSYSGSDTASWVGLDVMEDVGKIVQGIFIANGTFTNFTVTNNLIMTNAIGGIHDQDSTITSSGHTITNNTVLNNGNGNTTQIGWVGTTTLTGNIAETGGNETVQDDTPANSDYYEKLYATCISGDGVKGGRTINNFAIVADSVAEDNGAFALINSLLGESGGSSVTDNVQAFSELGFGEVVLAPDALTLAADQASLTASFQDATFLLGSVLVADNLALSVAFQDATFSTGTANVLVAETLVLSCTTPSAQIGDGGSLLPKGLKLTLTLGIT